MSHNFLRSLQAIPRSSMTESFDAQSHKASRSTRNSLLYNPASYGRQHSSSSSSIEMSEVSSITLWSMVGTIYRITHDKASVHGKSGIPPYQFSLPSELRDEAKQKGLMLSGNGTITSLPSSGFGFSNHRRRPPYWWVPLKAGRVLWMKGYDPFGAPGVSQPQRTHPALRGSH